MHNLAYFYPDGHENHAERSHPERPARVEAIVKVLDHLDLWQPYPKLQPMVVPEHILTGVHTRHHLSMIERHAQMARTIDNETYLTNQSWDLALQAAGGACSVASAVWQRVAARGFALTRPPGHHATSNRAMGFCLINNIAVAAEYLNREMGAKRLAIIDIDLHHGNGTQDIFYQRGDVFFVSTHQHPLYPGTGMLYETGKAEGKMKTLNVPLPPYSGDEALNTALRELILPLLKRYEPEMILVSAGMDAHWRDPLGHLLVTASGYNQAIRQMTAFADDFCGGRIALFLEGGYDLTGGSSCAAGAVTALLDEPFTDPGGNPPYEEEYAWRDIVQQAAKLFELPA